ncbi:putative disease resistance RPP13-like protein 3 isoform X2 [Brachypodium distachyon]|uniref:putative disease resistance RPP13-like protein 3 isoform X2 n=1 Tax=Brachypodium distachyon TaxID=15368 RepID=UPI000D0CFAB0|nr:putative disease resistance RPP13-like protein 3 isoform X2 [Brachypodium distachyon]|eukprot:XP_024311000.1 putative disease resistance RPP13-like protein 3 isoform X2 [Brachypodium distachyon]
MEAPVCDLVDVMYKLPAKLDGLLRHGHMLPKGAQDEIPLIKQDLVVMMAVLHDYSNSGADNCAMMIKCLMKEARELSYDIEDCIDQYEHVVDSTSRSFYRIPRRLITRCLITRRKSKTSRLPKKLQQRLWMANKIREFSMRSQEALQRYSLFNSDGISTASPGSSSTDSQKNISTASTRYDLSFGSWHPTLYGESTVHPVGIDAPMGKLKAWLTTDGEQNRKVISIAGSGGIGKTTLANKLYHTIGGQFECRAFLRTSQKPYIKKLLVSMLSQVRPHQPLHTWKVHNLIADIRTHLQDKRYLIIIDDVWSTSTWDIVIRALPESNHCSRIIITTEIEDVALKCCAYDPKYVFMMKPLSNDDSRILFFNTAFGCQHECSPDLLEVSNNIIRKCGGFPLALVTIASVLASRMDNLGQWDYVNNSLGYGLRTNPTLDGMKQVLNLSYDNLPQHLKACLLYLSVYQEDWIIWKDDLVKQWIAEGFICATEDKYKEEIARRYFDELISSRMIQPGHINYNDEVLSCTVHHMVLNLITHNSIEDNFIIAIDHSQTTARLADKVRRLSLHFGDAEDATPPTSMRLSQIRTLAFFGVFKSMPSIMEFQLLRVLVLQLWGDEENMSLDLTRISDLFRLRYFQVTSNVTLELRTQMQGLQYLETLKMDARLSVVPSDFCLPGLLHLNIPAGTKLPEGIFRMTSLRTLGYVDLNINSIENVHSLGELTNLQDLHLTYMAVPSGYLVGNMEFLGSILGKLSNLKSLTLVSAGSSHLCTTNAPYNPAGMIFSGDGLSSMPCPPALLHRLELPHICIFSSLPRWIRGLANLRILKIAVRELSKNDVDVLKKLPVLTVLSLYVATVPSERIAFDRTGFLLLRYFEFRCTMPWLKFEANAMPNLWKLKLGFSAHGNVCYGAMPVGIEYLSVLKEVSAKIWCVGPEESNIITAESVLRDTLSMHPGHLRVQVQHVDKIFDDEDDKSSVTKEDHRALKQCDMLVDDRNEQFDVLQKNMGEDTNKQADGWGLWSVGKGTSSTSFVENLAEGEAPWSIAFPLESPSTRDEIWASNSLICMASTLPVRRLNSMAHSQEFIHPGQCGPCGHSAFTIDGPNDAPNKWKICNLFVFLAYTFYPQLSSAGQLPLVQVLLCIWILVFLAL